MCCLSIYAVVFQPKEILMRARRSPVLCFAFVLSLVVLPVRGQVPAEKVDTDAINKIKEEGQKRSQVMEIISYMTDVHGPRLTGSPQTKAACEWAAGKMKEWGLHDAHLEPWGPFGRGWSLSGFTANMVEPSFTPLIAYPKAWSPSTSGTVRGEVVYFDAKTEADLQRYAGKLKGAIVLLSGPRELKAHFEPEGRRQTDEQLLGLANAEPRGGGMGDFSRFRNFQGSPDQRTARNLDSRKWQMCYSEGAAAILEPGRGDGGTLFVQSATLPSSGDTPFDRRPRPWSTDAPSIIPQLVLAAEHYNRIVRMVTKNVPVKLEVAVTAKFHADDLMSYNVVGEIPGTDLKEELVMLGGHYDSWHSGTGATDNAAGCGVAMEAMRILQKTGLKPRRTIRVALWTGEEQGLLGSRAYVSEHFGRRPEGPRPEGPRPGAAAGGAGAAAAGEAAATGRLELKPAHAHFAGYFNLDNGTGKIRGVYMQGNESVRPIFRAWLAPFRDMGAATLTSNNTGGTDHLSFDGVGLPGFQFIQDPVEYDSRTHHSNMDVYDRIQEDDMKQAAVIMASFAYLAATRDEKLPRKPAPTPRQGPGPR
jgi:hypothetical protein